MLKIEELTHAYFYSQCDFEKDVIMSNHFHSDWEADILIINAEGFSHEIEIKFSKSDFKNDFKKSYLNANTGQKYLKHDKISSGDYVCNTFSFLLPMGLIDHADIPDHCGIIEFYHDEDHWKTEFYIVRPPKILHKDSFWKLNDKDLFLRKMAFNFINKKLELKSKTTELVLKSPFDSNFK